MKQVLALFILLLNLNVFSQSRKAPRMAPILEKGYYVNNRNDTLWGQIQTNPPDPLELYSGFKFKAQRGGKLRAVDGRRAKAYGYGNKNFVMLEYNDKKFFAERLARGRLDFFEYQYMGKVNGYPGIESYFFIKDNGAEGDDAKLQELKKISNLFYKRSLKPYMKDQVMIWQDLNKYDFDKDNVVTAIKEFNQFYPAAAFNRGT